MRNTRPWSTTSTAGDGPRRPGRVWRLSFGLSGDGRKGLDRFRSAELWLGQRTGVRRSGRLWPTRRARDRVRVTAAWEVAPRQTELRQGQRSTSELQAKKLGLTESTDEGGKFVFGHAWGFRLASHGSRSGVVQRTASFSNWGSRACRSTTDRLDRYFHGRAVDHCALEIAIESVETLWSRRRAQLDKDRTHSEISIPASMPAKTRARPPSQRCRPATGKVRREILG